MVAFDDFDSRFAFLTGHPPFAWQRRLFQRLSCATNDLPDRLDLPTGLGKTSVMAIWLLARDRNPSLPRRLVYVVDRRAVVDQASEEARKLAERVSGLAISTLRGQLADRGDWLRDPTANAIVVGTVDMIGSRLLFEGYGVSRRMRPFHAGLLGVDTLLVLDESHLVPPFEQLLRQIAETVDLAPRDEGVRGLIPRFRLMPLSATGRSNKGDIFRLLDEDREDPKVTARLGAIKRLNFRSTDGKALERELAEEAWVLSDEGRAPARVLVYCNSRGVADKARTAIEKLAKSGKIEINTELFVGARRVREREKAADKLKDLGFLSGSTAPERPAFLIATSAGEVGVDLDADHLVMDLVPFERMVQRLGRVNRLGSKQASVVVLESPDAELPDDIKARAERCSTLLRRLPRDAEGRYDASPGALVKLRHDSEEAVKAASSPEPLYPALSRPLVDAWAMTSLKAHTGRPEVAPWLRGWIEDELQTTLVWRTHLPVRLAGERASRQEIDEFFEASPPHLTERLETRTDLVHKWLLDRARKLKESLDGDTTGGENTATNGAPPPLNEQKVVAIALGRSGEDTQVLTLDYLLNAGESNREKANLRQRIAGRTLILDARLGGLTEDGLFDPKEAKTAVAPDADADWERTIGFRVRSIHPGTESSDGDWHKPYLFDLRRDGEGNALRQLCIEKYRGATATEEERSLSPRCAQTLDEHEGWTALKARKLVTALGLAGELGDAIVLAARLHDEGKRALVWQHAFSAGRDAIYAKTTGPFRPTMLGGYRHEFGSLAYVERNEEFRTLPDDLKDLVLHLVAAHHGRARPVIETDGCDDGPPSVLEARARDVAQRFARVQKRFGPWGLAWLEALLRAADQQASRDLDEGRTPDGRS